MLGCECCVLHWLIPKSRETPQRWTKGKRKDCQCLWWHHLASWETFLDFSVSVSLPFSCAPSLHQSYYILIVNNKEVFLTQYSLFPPSPPVYHSAAFPSIKRMKNPVLGDEGSRLIVKCEATGSPTPEYKWYKDGAELKKSKEIRIRNVKWVSISTSPHQHFQKYMRSWPSHQTFGQCTRHCLCSCN